MSTNYYYLRSPITKIIIVEEGAHDKVHVWVLHGHAGALTVPKGQGTSVCRCFIDEGREPPIHTYSGGVEKGTVVSERASELDPSLTLVSEYGEPITVKEIRALAGIGRRA